MYLVLFYRNVYFARKIIVFSVKKKGNSQTLSIIKTFGLGVWSGWFSVILELWAGNAIVQTIPCGYLITLLKMSKKYLRKNDTVSSFTADVKNKPVKTLIKISSSTSRNLWSQSKLVQKKKIVILIQWNVLNTNTKWTKRSHTKWCN